MDFKKIVNTVKSEAGDAVEITKLKAKISKEKSTIKDSYQALGEMIYKRYEAGGFEDAEMESLFADITNAKNSIEDLNNQIDKIKKVES